VLKASLIPCCCVSGRELKLLSNVGLMVSACAGPRRDEAREDQGGKPDRHT